MLSFVMFSSAAGNACSGRIESYSTNQPRKQLSAKAGSLLWASGTHPITNPIQNALAFQVFCCFSEENNLLWNKCCIRHKPEWKCGVSLCQ